MAKLLQIEQSSFDGIRQSPTPSEESITKFWDRERFAYEILRHQRVKTIEDQEFVIPLKFIEQVKLFVESFPEMPVQCEMYYFRISDVGKTLPLPRARVFSQYLVRFGVAISPVLGAEYNRFCLLTKSASLESILRWSDAHLIIFDLQSTYLCLSRGDLPIESQCQRILNKYLPRITCQTFCLDVSHKPPDLRPLAPAILPWVVNRNCLIQMSKGNRLSFLRNEEGDTIQLNEIDGIKAYMERGAVAFVPDSCCIQSNKIVADMGCVDIDLKARIDYERVYGRIMEYLRFLEEEVQIKPILTHSGNQSFHVRILLSATEIGGFFLPRNRPFESFIRTIKDVMGVVTVRDAIEISTMAYNKYTRLGKVMRRGTKPREFYFDNRTGVNIGARCPGSWRPKTNTLSRNFLPEEVPAYLGDLRSELNADAILKRVTRGEESLISLPKIDFQVRKRNVQNLVQYARDYIEAKLESLWGFYDAGQDSPICRDCDTHGNSA